MQDKFKLWCQCAHHEQHANGLGGRGERLKVDLLWFTPRPDLSEDEQEWIAPSVAIEHENDYAQQSRDVDHWKVSQIAAPLRVFIGYTQHVRYRDDAARRLMKREERWNAVAGGESLIILGHPEMEYDCFRAWSAPQGSTNWQQLAPTGACPHE